MKRTKRILYCTLLLLLTTTFQGSAAQEVKDPIKEAARKREHQLTARNYQELKDAAAELLAVSKDLNDEVVGKSGEHVISAAIFEKVDKIDKLSRKIRDKAKGAY